MFMFVHFFLRSSASKSVYFLIDICLLNHSNQKLYSIKSRFTPSKKKMLYSFVTNPSLEFFISGIQIPLLNKIHRTKKLILIKLHRISCDRVSINYLRSFF